MSGRARAREGHVAQPPRGQLRRRRVGAVLAVARREDARTRTGGRPHAWSASASSRFGAAQRVQREHRRVVEAHREARARDHQREIAIGEPSHAGVDGCEAPRPVGVGAVAAGLKERVHQRHARPRGDRRDGVVDVAVERGPAYARRIGGPAPVKVSPPSPSFTSKAPPVCAIGRPTTSVPIEVGRARRVLATEEVPAHRVHDHVGELRGEVLAWRERRLDLVEDRLGVEPHDPRVAAGAQAERVAHVAVDAGDTALAEGSRLASFRSHATQVGRATRAGAPPGGAIAGPSSTRASPPQ